MRFASSSGANDATALPVRDKNWAAGLGARLVSAIAMAVAALIAVFAGETAFAILIAAATGVLAWEWARLTGEGRFGATGIVLAVATMALVAAAVLGWFEAAIMGAFVAGALVFVVAMADGRRLRLWVAVGVLYIGLPAVAMIWLRGHGEAGRALMLWLLLTIWATDSGAFFAGRLIGGPKLAPRISPKKTWAGLGGAVVSAAWVGIIVGGLDPHAPDTVLLALGGAILAVVAQAGDLAESWVKRHFGAKDSSNLIPGHGGLFDRVDGLLVAALVLALGQWLTDWAFAWR